MKVGINEVTESVLRRLNENPEPLANLIEYEEPWMNVRSLTEALIPEVAERVILEADSESIGECLPLSGSVVRRTVDDRTVCLLTLPDDCLRLVYIRMSDWTEPVCRFVSSRSDVAGYRRLRDRRVRAGDKGTPTVVSCYHERKRAVEIFGSVGGSRLAEGGYLPRPVKDPEGNLVFPSSLKGELIEKMVETVKKIME